MPDRLVTTFQGVNNCRRCHELDNCYRQLIERYRRAIACKGPFMCTVLANSKKTVIGMDHCSIWQGYNLWHCKANRSGTCGQPALAMQQSVDFRRFHQAEFISRCIIFGKRACAGPPAKIARPVPRCQTGYLIKEKQFCPANMIARTIAPPNISAAPRPLAIAQYPAFRCPAAARQCLVVRIMDYATIANKQATRRNGIQTSIRCNTIL
jgi:hypothetical protein